MPTDHPPAASPPSPTPVKPRGFSAVVGLTLAMGILGLLAGLGGLLGGAALKKMNDPFGTLRATRQGNTPSAEQARRIADVQQRMLEASRPAPAVLLYAIALPVGAWLLVALRRLSRRERGATRTFAGAVALFGALEVLFLVLQIAIHLRTRPLIEELIQAMAVGSDPHLPASFGRAMGSVMYISMMVGIVMSFGWSLAKIGFALYAQRYARKPEVRAWVEGSATA